MTAEPRCPRCHSNRIIPKARVLDRAQGGGGLNLTVEVCEQPDAILFKGARRSELFARVCGECGFTELNVEHPEDLYYAYEESQRNSGE